MVAAAWLHDTVEDTPATFEEIEREFGADVAALVKELTDVSRPGDGNRAARKAIDREHTAAASPRAKTIKLADIIDNCEDICRHDPKFGRVYLGEARALLAVLAEGDAGAARAGRRAGRGLRGSGSPAAPPRTRAGGAGARGAGRQAGARRAARHPAVHGGVRGAGHPGAAALLRRGDGRAACRRGSGRGRTGRSSGCGGAGRRRGYLLREDVRRARRSGCGRSIRGSASPWMRR